MKFCPIVPEICCGQVHGPRKERRKRIRIIIIKITRYDYNLTIMKSPKPATDTIYPHIKFWWYRTMFNFCGIVAAILKMVTGKNCSMLGINSGHHYLPTYQILMISDNVEFLPPFFYAVFWQPFWKWQTSRKFWKRRIAPLMVTYHYVKFYVSIIIYLEVININVRNFNFFIGFYSNPHPLWTPQNMTLTPFTTKLKTLGPTRNIYL